MLGFILSVNGFFLECNSKFSDNIYTVNSSRYFLSQKIIFLFLIICYVICPDADLPLTTSKTTCNDSSIDKLPAQVIKCPGNPDGQALIGFHMDADSSCSLWSFDFGCIQTGQTDATINTYSTSSIDVSGKDVLNDFRDFDLSCPTSQAMVSFQIIRMSNGNYYYSYSCIKAILTSCISHSTSTSNCGSWPSDNKASNLENHKVYVGANRVLTRFYFSLNDWGAFSSCQMSIKYYSCIVTPCHQSCSTCITSASNCLTCSDGYFSNVGQTTPCNPCDISCKTCSGSATKCILCNTNYFKKLNDSNSNCFDTSPIGYYLNTAVTPDVYYPCDISCQTCTLNSKKCTLCADGFYKKENDTTDFCFNTVSGYYLNTNLIPQLFSACHSSCKECSSNAVTCDVCNTNFYYKENEDTKACYSSINGYFLNSDISPKKFSICVSPCNYCSSLTFCLTCIDSKYIKDDENTGVCYSEKPSGYYLNSSSYTPSKYSKCDITCNECNTLYSCVNCSGGYYKKENDSSNQCFLPTIEGFYLNNNINLMSQCDSSCKFCNGNSDIKSCFTCMTNFYKKENDSSNYCFQNPKGYFLKSSNNLYSLCDISCSFCNGNIDLKQCNTCSENYYKVDGQTTDYCYDTPPTGYYFDKNSLLLKYLKCDVSCLTCLNSATYCLTCNNGSNYYNTIENPNLCSNTVPFGYYLDMTALKYLVCNVSCKTCITTSTFCQECNNSAYYYFKVDNINQCILKTNSPQGYYFDSITLKHEKCDISCLTCIDSKKNCTSCNIPGKFYNTLETPNSCLNSPPFGYYLDILQSKYLICDVSCDGCVENYKKCLNCKINSPKDQKLNYYGLENYPSSCFLISETPYYYYFNSDKLVFSQCDNSCKKCEKSPNYCLLCNDNYNYLLLTPSVCVTVCPIKTWKNILDRNCVPCDVSCKNCLDNTKNCLECEAGYFPLEDNKKLCFSNCPAGYVFDTANKMCKKCPTNCEACNLDDTCIKCFENYFLNKNLKQCFLKCDPGFYANRLERVCSECVYPCLECSSSDVCLSCPEKLFLNPLLTKVNCVNNCPDGYWGDSSNNQCSKCDLKCKLCQNLKNCLSCNDDFYFLKENSQCLINCPQQLYFNSEKNDLKSNLNQIKITDSVKTCEKCEVGCSHCINTKDFCLACNSNYFLIENQNKCVENCPLENYYADININKCLNCHPTCKSCKGPQIKECLSCDLESGLVLKNGYCIKEGCPPGFILLDNNSCYGLKNCIESANLSVPKIFNIEADPLKGNFEFKIKEICASYKKGFGIMWDRNSTMYEKAIISGDGSTYMIKRDDIVEGLFNLRINIYYNFNYILTSLNQTSILVLNKLIPKTSVENMSFIFGYDIMIDASNSIDEGLLRMGKNLDPLLLFSWECPEILKILCLEYTEPKAENKILILKYIDYKSLLTVDKESIYSFVLKLNKDRRTADKAITIKLKNKKNYLGQNTTNSDTLNNTVSEEIDLTDLIIVDQKRIGNSKLMFIVTFLNEKIDMKNYNYNWKILHFYSDSQYLNSNNEINLIINYSDLLVGLNIIELKITNLKSQKMYSKSIEFIKDLYPYGGSCQPNLNTGFSLKTEINFIIENWKSNALPLVYKIKYQNKNNILIDLSDGGFFENKFMTNRLPASDKFFLEVIDNQGSSVLTPCSVTINQNKNLPSIEEILEGVFDQSKKIVLFEIYISNKKENEIDDSLVNKSINLVDNLFDKISAENFLENYDNIISALITITKSNFDRDKINTIYNILKLIVQYLDPTYIEISKLNSMYAVLDNLSKKVGDYSKNVQSENEKTDVLEMLKFLQGILDSLNDKLFNNIISGQNLIIVNKNFDSQMNKVSTYNIKSICVGNSDEVLFLKKNFKRIRNLQMKENCRQENQVMNLESKLLADLMKNQTTSNIGFQSQLNKNKNLPIETSKERQVFSESSMSFGLSAGDKANGKLRNLIENLMITFEIRLKIPSIRYNSSNNNEDENSDVGDTACVQYSNSTQPKVSCASWYDDFTNEVVCVCSQQGLTVNVQDKAISNISKLSQFPSLSADICSLIIIFLLFYFLADHIDKEDNKSKQYMQHFHFDNIQYYIIKYCQENFHKKYTFFKIYCHLIKNLHPLISPLFIYSPSYKRTLRILDFFLTIYLSFFFTLLPFYYSDNSQLVSVAANRSVQDRNKNINDIGTNIKQIIQGVLYSVFASICTFIINTILTLLLYQNVMIEETQKKASILNKAFKRINNLSENWHLKLKRAYSKVKIFLIITNDYRKKINPISDNTSKGSYCFKKIQANDQEDVRAKLLRLQIFSPSKKILKEERNKLLPQKDNMPLVLNDLKNNNKIFGYKIINEEEITIYENPEKQKNISNNNNINNLIKLNCDISNSKNKQTKIKIDNDINYLLKNRNSIEDEKIPTDLKINLICSSNKVEENRNIDELLSPIIIPKNNFEQLKFNKKNNQLLKKGSSNDFFLKKNKSKFIKEVQINNNENNNILRDENLLFKNHNLLKIENFDICFNSKKKTNSYSKKQKRIITIKNRPYLFIGNNKNQFSSQEISIQKIMMLDNIAMLIKSEIKSILVMLLFLYLWLYMMLFIQSIYKQYGNNIFKICIMPLLSMLFIKMAITFNVMMLLTTIILYFWGDYFRNTTRPNFIKMIIFKALVPPLAFAHYNALRTFRELIKNE